MSVLGFGPRVRGALPLQQLAGTDAQPLARLLVAWLPAGALSAAILSRARPLSRAARAAAVALMAFAVLVPAGAVSDAVAISDPIATHLDAQLSRAGTLVAVALMGAGALLSPWRRARAARPAPSAG